MKRSTRALDRAIAAIKQLPRRRPAPAARHWLDRHEAEQDRREADLARRIKGDDHG